MLRRSDSAEKAVEKVIPLMTELILVSRQRTKGYQWQWNLHDYSETLWLGTYSRTVPILSQRYAELPEWVELAYAFILTIHWLFLQTVFCHMRHVSKFEPGLDLDVNTASWGVIQGQGCHVYGKYVSRKLQFVGTIA